MLCSGAYTEQGQKFGENPRIYSRKDSSQQNCDSKWILVIIYVYHMARIHGFLQNSPARIQMDSRTWS